MVSRKMIPGFASLALGFMLMFLTACSSGGDSRSANATNANASPSEKPVTAPAAPKAKLNVNTASDADLLATIPNFGNRMVHEFEEYRPYKSILVFRKEITKYVAPAVVADYEKYIFVPIDENQSDAATLQQIPGLDANEAQELIAARPYPSGAAFLAKLGGKVSAAELTIAKTYLAQP